MRKSHLAAVLATAVAASSSMALAGFTVTAVRTNINASLDRVDIFALNTGGGTGTQLKGVSLNYSTPNGSRVYFTGTDTEVDGNGDPAPDGIVDTVDLFNLSTTANKSLIRANTTSTNNSYVGVSPSPLYTQPNPWIDGTTTFAVSIANLGTTQASSGTGFRFARLFTDASSQGTVAGQIGGDIGTAQPYTVSWGAPTNVAPTVAVSVSPLVIDVSPAGLESGSTVISAADSDGTVASLVAGVLPAVLADNISITGPAAGPKTLSLSGLTYSDLGSYSIVFTATDNLGATGTGTVLINIVPEPATLGLLAGAGLVALRRRK
jgi:hypothetical protein